MYKILPILLFAYGLAITTDDIYDNSYALIIGINHYHNVDPLNYAVKDAVSIQHILINSFDFQAENTILLTDEEATKTSILQEFSNLTKKAGENDRVLIFFAGHGMTGDLPSGGELGYLIPVDGNIHNLYISSIGMNEFHNISLMTNAKHMLYLVDACYGGISIYQPRGADYKQTSNNYIKKITKNKSRQIITAGGRGEMTIEKPEWGHSAFTLNLISGLQDGNADMDMDNVITANELGIFLQKSVNFDSEGIQTPLSGRMSMDEGEFIFIKNNNEEVDLEDIWEKYQQENVTEQFKSLIWEELENKEKQKLFDIIIGNLDSVMQSSNFDSLLSEMSKEQLITIMKLSADKKKNLSDNAKEKKPLREKGDFYDNSYAVIIGINEYTNTNSPKLTYAVSDAKAIKELLVNKLGFKDENIQLLLDKEATFSSIRNALYSVSKLAKKNDRTLIYFSGHGQTIKALQSEMQIGYLIPVNGDIKDPTLNGIPMDDIFRICQSKSKHMLFLMDACYSGLMAKPKGLKILEDNADNYIHSVVNTSARQIITAGTGEQEAWEGDKWQHSVFTLNLLKAFDNWEADNIIEDGYITATELGQYLHAAVSKATHSKQTPQIERIKYSKTGEFIFFQNP
jgi:uncharacterized caspase-like protein